MTSAAPTAGSCWRGTDQESWWRLLYADPAGGRWRALCMKAPDRYQWVQPGEERWIRDELFDRGDLVPLVGQLDQVDALDAPPGGGVPGLLP
jgi:hypothetical protein